MPVCHKSQRTYLKLVSASFAVALVGVTQATYAIDKGSSTSNWPTLLGSTSFNPNLVSSRSLEKGSPLDLGLTRGSKQPGRNAGGDATLTWTGGGGANNNVSSPLNWGGLTPVAGDNLVFGPTPTGDYTANNDLAATTFAELNVNRAAVTETTTLTGGYSGLNLKVINGKFVGSGGSYNLPASDTEYAVSAGTGLDKNGTVTFNNGATANFWDFDLGSKSDATDLRGGTGNLIVDGAGTTVTGTLAPATSSSRIESDGFGVSNVSVLNGATLDVNQVLPNNVDNYTITGSTLNTTAFSSYPRIVLGAFGTDADPNIPASTASFTATAGSTVNTGFLAYSQGLGTVGTMNLSGAGTVLNATVRAQIGAMADTAGVGSTNVTVDTGAVANIASLWLGVGTTTAVPAAVSGNTNFTVTGTGSRVNIVGVTEFTGLPATFNPVGDVYVGYNAGNRSTLNVTDGAVFDMFDDTNPDSELNGDMVLAFDTNAEGTVNVDNAVLDSGTGLFMAGFSAFTNGKATVNVTNGGVIFINGNSTVFGVLSLGGQASAGSSSTLNITGTLADPSGVIVDGITYVGGRGGFPFDPPNDVPVAGTPSTVNINGGGGVLASLIMNVYAGSTVNVTGGEVNSTFLGATGGTYNLGTTGTAGDAILIGDEWYASAGGTFNLGKHGGISFIVDTDTEVDEDLSEIKALIAAGRNGGAWNGVNGITSSLLNSTTTAYAIGYADIDAAGITSFFGVDFLPEDEAVVFRYTRVGDADLSGTVSFDDLLKLAQNYAPGVTGKEWWEGDFTYNGIVDFDDLLGLAQNYNLAASVTGSFAGDWELARSMVPEPTTLAALGLGALALGRRRSAR